MKKRRKAQIDLSIPKEVDGKVIEYDGKTYVQFETLGRNLNKEFVTYEAPTEDVPSDMKRFFRNGYYGILMKQIESSDIFKKAREMTINQAIMMKMMRENRKAMRTIRAACR